MDQRPASRRRGFVVGGALLMVAAGIAIAYQRAHATTEPRFVTQKVERGRLVARVTATGTLSALVTVQVGSQVSGNILEIHADFNTQVKKGQLIARIDPRLFDAAVEQARANYVAAVGQLDKSKAQAVDAQRQYERSKKLRDQNLIAQADLDTAQSNADAAKAQVAASAGAVEQAKASLHQAEINLKYTTIESPINGVVISRSVDVGQTVAASLQAPTLFTIAEDLKKMQVDTSVSEADVGKLRPGMNATFTVDAYPAEKFKGVVRQIRNAPQTVQNVVTYDAVIDVDNAELKLKPGMTANATFVYAEVDDTIRIPNAALRFRPPSAKSSNDHSAKRTKGKDGQDHRTVWLLKGTEPSATPVHTGVSDGTFTQVVDGAVEVGDLVVTDSAGADARNPSSTNSPFRRGF